MSPRSTLAIFGAVLVAALGAGAGVGSVVGPFGDGVLADGSVVAADAAPTTEADLPSGLSMIENGYRFVPQDRLADQGRFTFTIVGPDGAAVRDFDVVHDRELHLIVASTDLQHYAHVHADRDPDGLWTTELPQLPPGGYRAFADFKPAGGTKHTLGIDLMVPGMAEAPVALQVRDHTSVDGFDVTVHTAATSASGSEVVVTVRRNGATVLTEPYLGAAGHLVALRDGDLAYLHVHPLDDAPKGPVSFAIEVPSAGTYGLFFEFQVDGVVHTARFVMNFGEGATHAH
ncbi:MAG: hypothetical protein ACKV2O_20410 [Acidimicrobiales bacterium]